MIIDGPMSCYSVCRNFRRSARGHVCYIQRFVEVHVGSCMDLLGTVSLAS